MRLIERDVERGPVVSAGIIAGATMLLAVTVVTGLSPVRVAPLLGLAIVFGVWWNRLLSWRSLLALTLVIIFFVPIRRYSLPGNLPFELEPYRLFIGLVLVGWISALLVDPRVRLRSLGCEWPLLVIVAAAAASIIVNWSRNSKLGVEPDEAKKLSFLLTFILVVYLIVSVVRSFEDVNLMVRILVCCGVVLACFAIFEGITGYNLFNHLSGAFPFLRPESVPYTLNDNRDGRLRVYASAQHPIALSAVLVMMVPLAAYLAATRPNRKIWWAAVILLIVGSVSTISRTGMIMLVVVGLTFLWLRPRQTRRLWPLLVPLLVIVHLALPGALGAFKDAFFPSGGLVAEQSRGAGTGGSGRIADLSPGIHEWMHAPLLGEGYGSRVVDGPTPNAPILDNQWLGTLLETGAVGVIGWLWLLTVIIRRLVRRARLQADDRGLLCVALTGAVLAFSVGMVTYDAFSFIQVTFVLFFLLALGAVATEKDTARTALVSVSAG